MKRILFLILSVTMFMANSISAFAQEDIHVFGDEPPILLDDEDIISTRGASKPDKNASIHDLSVSSYNYQVQKVGYAVYSDKWLTGKTSMSISVKNWTVLSNPTVSDKTITFTLYDSNNNSVASKSITVSSQGTGSTSFSNLTKTEKYYVKTSVNNTGATYSFDGTIS